MIDDATRSFLAGWFVDLGGAYISLSHSSHKSDM